MVAETATTCAKKVSNIEKMLDLTIDYHRTKIHHPLPIYSGLDSYLYRCVNNARSGKTAVAELVQEAQTIDAQSKTWQVLSDEALKEKLVEFKQIFRRRKNGYQKQLPDAMAALREAAHRCLGLRPFVVQLAGTLALHKGFVAELATGEGKTLCIGMAAVLNGWSGFPCHVITVNDYLAQRDAEWMAKLFEFCGVSVGYVVSEMDPSARKTGYNNEVTYTTCKEIVADFLRDRLWLGELQNFSRRQIRSILGRKTDIERGLVMRGIHFGIIDEADSILIDEAVTPLIISRQIPNETFIETCKVAHRIASTLIRDQHYTVNQKYKEIELSPDLDSYLESNGGQEIGKYAKAGTKLELIKMALTAREFFHRDKQYVIQEGKIVLVDEFTGRLMPQRTWQAGLHQFVEAKENLEMSVPTETLARLSFQRFFRFFNHLSGMTGTAQESLSEFLSIYRLPVVSIPENRPCQRTQFRTQIYIDQELKWQAILDEICTMHKQGRPVLVGTRNVRTSENLSQRLLQLGLPHRVLNAIRHKEEARIIAHAGEEGAITIATNMAGRGTDIRLGLNLVEKGGLHVIATECHESRRIDRQLFGRAARQGDPGSARLFVSLDDELLGRYVPAFFLSMTKTALKNRTQHSEWLARRIVRLAQITSQRQAFQQRKAILNMDTWLEDSLSFTQGDFS